mmetsp:Transcript_19475/g.73621  ORF Transcript_19475/g.73621 Transcript_19475/m.73621 type:complete len:222 (+) Transcript_19475:1287-1952(+)
MFHAATHEEPDNDKHLSKLRPCAARFKRFKPLLHLRLVVSAKAHRILAAPAGDRLYHEDRVALVGQRIHRALRDVEGRRSGRLDVPLEVGLVLVVVEEAKAEHKETALLVAAAESTADEAEASASPGAGLVEPASLGRHDTYDATATHMGRGRGSHGRERSVEESLHGGRLPFSLGDVIGRHATVSVLVSLRVAILLQWLSDVDLGVVLVAIKRPRKRLRV